MQQFRDQIIRSVESSISRLDSCSSFRVMKCSEEIKSLCNFYFEYGILNYDEYQECLFYLREAVVSALTREDKR